MRRISPAVRWIAVVAALAILSACALLPGAIGAALDGEWRLISGTQAGQPVPIVAGSRITLRVDGGTVGGSAACNTYSGTLEIHGTTIAISALSMTEMACQEDLMASEAAYLAALPRVTAAARSGDSLVLSGPGVELRYALVPPVADVNLVGTSWVLDSLISGDVVSSTVGGPATLQLNADGTILASTGCRTVNGQYTISGDVVQVTLAPYDLIACAGSVGDQDAHVLRVISQRFTVAISGASLTVSAGAEGLGYRAGAAGS
jgi:heat shock protein HslJ